MDTSLVKTNLRATTKSLKNLHLSSNHTSWCFLICKSMKNIKRLELLTKGDLVVLQTTAISNTLLISLNFIKPLNFLALMRNLPKCMVTITFWKSKLAIFMKI